MFSSGAQRIAHRSQNHSVHIIKRPSGGFCAKKVVQISLKIRFFAASH